MERQRLDLQVHCLAVFFVLYDPFYIAGQTANDVLLRELEDLRGSLTRMESTFARKEENLRREITDLTERLDVRCRMLVFDIS